MRLSIAVLLIVSACGRPRFDLSGKPIAAPAAPGEMPPEQCSVARAGLLRGAATRAAVSGGFLANGILGAAVSTAGFVLASDDPAGVRGGNQRVFLVSGLLGVTVAVISGLALSSASADLEAASLAECPAQTAPAAAVE